MGQSPTGSCVVNISIAIMGRIRSNWSWLVIISVASCLICVQSKSDARYGSYSSYRSKYNPGYYSRYGNYHKAGPVHHHKKHVRKYGYKIVSPPHTPSERFIRPQPVNTKPVQQQPEQSVSPRFSVNIDFNNPPPVINRVKVEKPKKVVKPKPTPQKVFKPEPKPQIPSFPERISAPLIVKERKAQPLPAPVPAVPSFQPPSDPSPLPPPPPSTPSLASPPAPRQPAASPILPQAFPAVPGRPIVSEPSSPARQTASSSSSEAVDRNVSMFVPMPVPAVPGL